jgi:hypothetical protein
LVWFVVFIFQFFFYLSFRSVHALSQFLLYFSCHRSLTNSDLTYKYSCSYTAMLCYVGCPVKIWIMGPEGPETKNDFAGEGQQQFTRQTDKL